MNKSIRLSKHKTFEVQLELWDSEFARDFFEFKLQWTRKCDHAGPEFTLSIIKLFWLNIKIYDHRHWNDDENRWAQPGDE